MGKLFFIGLMVFLLNLPFGYWRASVKRFSTQWFLAIHLAVILEIALRLLSQIGFAWYTYVVLVAAFFLGQYVGGMILKRFKLRSNENTS